MSMRSRWLVLVGGLVVLASCGQNEAERRAPTTSTSTTAPSAGGDPAMLVLRISTAGGFVPPGYAFAAIPELSVYGDGSVITVGPQVAIYPGPALPNIQRAHITGGEVQALLAGARGAGVTDAAPDTGRPPIADAPATTFFVRDTSGTATVTVEALLEAKAGGSSGLTAVQRANRARLAAFRDQASRIADGRPSERFPVMSLAVLITPADAQSGSPPEPSDVEWPGENLQIRAATDRFGGRCVTITGDELTRVLPTVEKARANARWHSAGRVFQLAFRPELPDEHVCAATG